MTRPVLTSARARALGSLPVAAAWSVLIWVMIRKVPTTYPCPTVDALDEPTP